MQGGTDLMTDLVLGAVTGREERHVYACMVPGFICHLAGWFCPF